MNENADQTVVSGADGRIHRKRQDLVSYYSKRWRANRDLVIYVAHSRGIPNKLLAEVFDLPASRITQIVKRFKTAANDRP